MNSEFVSSRQQFSGQRNIEGSVSVWVCIKYLPVQEDVTVHIDTVKIQLNDRIMALRKFYCSPVPGVGGFIEVALLPDQPVVRQVDRLKNSFPRIGGAAPLFQFCKEPSVIDQRPHIDSLRSFIPF